jgi:hypothetical protein
VMRPVPLRGLNTMYLHQYSIRICSCPFFHNFFKVTSETVKKK